MKSAGGAVGGGSDGRDLGEEVRLKHSKLVQQVSLFCNVGSGYLPLGAESARYVFGDPGE